MPKLEVDHIVLAVPDLNEAIKYFKDSLNVTPLMGGKHVGLGTHNALFGLGNPSQKLYLELLAIDLEDHSIYENYPMGITKGFTSPYVASWCIRCPTNSNIEAINKEIKKIDEAYNHGEVRKGQRKTTSGEILSWNIVINYEKILASRGQIPFLIQWNNFTEHPTTNLTLDNFCSFNLAFYSTQAKQLEKNLKSLGLELPLNINFFDSNLPHSKLEISNKNSSITF